MDLLEESTPYVLIKKLFAFKMEVSRNKTAFGIPAINQNIKNLISKI